jgi:hypothetical protein
MVSEESMIMCHVTSTIVLGLAWCNFSPSLSLPLPLSCLVSRHVRIGNLFPNAFVLAVNMVEVLVVVVVVWVGDPG